MATAQSLCNRNVVVAHPAEGLREVSRRLLDADAVCAVVVDPVSGVRPIGVVSDRDMLVGMFERSDAQARSLTIGDVMSLDLVVAHANDPATDTLARMQRFDVRRMPVVDERGALIGLIVLDDLIDFLSGEVLFLTGLLGTERAWREGKVTRRGFRIIDGCGSALG